MVCIEKEHKLRESLCSKIYQKILETSQILLYRTGKRIATNSCQQDLISKSKGKED